MKKLFALILGMLLLLCPIALADSAADDITVLGTATVRSEPDIAVISLGVRETNAEVSSAQSLVNEKINAIIDALTGDMALDKADISTTDYSIYPNYRYNYETGEETANGYIASCMLSVIVRDVDASGAVIDAAFAAGANQLYNVTFSLEDSSELEDKALEMAVANGMHRAEVVAKAAGITLPAVPSAIVEGAAANNYYRTASYAMDSASVGAGTQIIAGSVEMTVTVSISYDLDD